MMNPPYDDIFAFYHIHEKKLGEGGFGKVRLGTHLATGLEVAIKCLDKIKLGPELPRVYNEIQCLKKLKHRNIARLYQVFETQTVIYIVLEHCPGGELFDYIVSKSKLDEAEANKIFYDLIKVLDFIHINGFAHRDLKPENVLFDEQHQIKLIDFGLAANCSIENMATNRSQKPINQLSTCCGSVTYAAPEVISGCLYSGEAVDIWSAGVMLYALLVGQLPFNDSNIPKLYAKIKSGIKTLPSFLSSDAKDMIFRMLTVDPKQRITIRQILSHPWLTRNRHNNLARVNRRLEFNGSNQIDEQLIAKCCEKFPNITISQMREHIKKDFNYYSTTYHLMNSKRPPISIQRTIAGSMPVKRTPDRIPLATGSPRAIFNAIKNQEPNPSSYHSSPTKRSRFESSTNGSPINTPQTSDRPPVGKPFTQQTPGSVLASPYITPSRKSHFATVFHTPKTPRTPPSHLKRLHEHLRTPRRRDQENISSTITRPTPKKASIVKRILQSATPKKLRSRIIRALD